MNNGVGYARICEYANVMLGTDGIGADMWNESRTAFLKSSDAQRTLPIGRPLAMLGMSARLGSACLGEKLGILETGAAADLVQVKYRPATPLSAENLAGHFLFAMGPEFVRDVMVAGKWLMRSGEVVFCDERALRCRSVDVARDLHTRMAEIPC